jgi:epoxyqueuosine reductase QueG
VEIFDVRRTNMITKSELIEHALSIGFADIGFTSAEPFTEQPDWIYLTALTPKIYYPVQKQ